MQGDYRQRNWNYWPKFQRSLQLRNFWNGLALVIFFIEWTLLNIKRPKTDRRWSVFSQQNVKRVFFAETDETFVPLVFLWSLFEILKANSCKEITNFGFKRLNEAFAEMTSLDCFTLGLQGLKKSAIILYNFIFRKEIDDEGLSYFNLSKSPNLSELDLNFSR